MTHMTHSLYEGLGKMRVVIRGWYCVRRALVREMRHMRHVRHASLEPHCSACSAPTGHDQGLRRPPAGSLGRRRARTRLSVGNPDTLGFMTTPRTGAALGR